MLPLCHHLLVPLKKLRYVFQLHLDLVYPLGQIQIIISGNTSGAKRTLCIDFCWSATDLSGHITTGHILGDCCGGDRDGCDCQYKNSQSHYAEAGDLINIHTYNQ